MSGGPRVGRSSHKTCEGLPSLEDRTLKPAEYMPDLSRSRVGEGSEGGVVSSVARLYSRLIGKRVALVGGGPIESEAQIRRADLVVWINNHWRSELNFSGCFACGLDAPLFHYPDPVFIACQFDAPEAPSWEELALRTGALYMPIDSRQYYAPNPFSSEFEWTNRLCHELGTKPLSGIIATEFLLSMPIAALYLTGFSFYEEDGRVPFKVNSHMIGSQIDYMRRKIETDSRVEPDSVLKRLTGATGLKRPGLVHYRIIEKKGETIWKAEEISAETREVSLLQRASGVDIKGSTTTSPCSTDEPTRTDVPV